MNKYLSDYVISELTEKEYLEKLGNSIATIYFEKLKNHVSSIKKNNEEHIGNDLGNYSFGTYKINKKKLLSLAGTGIICGYILYKIYQLAKKEISVLTKISDSLNKFVNLYEKSQKSNDIILKERTNQLSNISSNLGIISSCVRSAYDRTGNTFHSTRY